MNIQVDILKQGKLSVIEEDIEVALEKAGLHPGDAEIEGYYEPDEDNAFVVVMPGQFTVDCARLKAIIEADTGATVEVNRYSD